MNFSFIQVQLVRFITIVLEHEVPWFLTNSISDLVFRKKRSEKVWMIRNRVGQLLVEHTRCKD